MCVCLFVHVCVAESITSEHVVMCKVWTKSIELFTDSFLLIVVWLVAFILLVSPHLSPPPPPMISAALGYMCVARLYVCDI